MKPSTLLFDLIQSLSKEERSAFQTFARWKGGNKPHKYLLLFECMATESSYNEELIKEKITQDIPSRNFAFQKNYLRNQLFEFLLQQQEHLDKETQALNQLALIKLLFRRGHIKLALEEFEKAQQQIESLDSTLFKFLLSNVEKELIEQRFLSGRYADLYKKYFENRTQLLEELTHEMALQEQGYKFVQLLSARHFSRKSDELKKFKKLVKADIVKQALHGKRRKEKLYALELESRYAGLAKDTDAFLSLKKTIYREVCHSKFFYDDIYFSYIQCHNYLLALSEAALYNDMPEVFEKVELLLQEAKNKKFEQYYRDIMLHYLAHLLDYCWKINASDRFEDTVKRIHRFHESGNMNLQTPATFVMLYNLCAQLVYLGRYRESIKWIELLLEHGKNYMRMDLYCYSRLLENIIQFLQGNYQVLEHSALATEKYLKGKQMLVKPELAILRVLSRSHHYQQKGVLPAKWKKLREDIKDYAEMKDYELSFYYLDLKHILNSIVIK